jgi:hypothetical protein
MGAVCEKSDPNTQKIKKFLKTYDSFNNVQFESVVKARGKEAQAKGYEIKISEQMKLFYKYKDELISKITNYRNK